MRIPIKNMSHSERQKAHEIIRNRERFYGGSRRPEMGGIYSMRSEDRLNGFGVLPREWWEIAREHAPSYVIYSYETPIAWYSEEFGWHMPNKRYSASTGWHQSLVRGALAEEMN